MTIAGKAIDIKCGNAKLPRMMELCTVEQLCQSFNASTDTLYIVRISQCNESGTSCGVGHPAQCN